MKKLILASALLFSCMIGLAQESTSEFRDFKNELSFGVLGAGEVRGFGFAVPALGYRRLVDNGALRLQVGAFLNTQSNSFNGGTTRNEEKAVVLRGGYQYHVMLGRFMPAIGIDAYGGLYESLNSFAGVNSNDVSQWSAGVSPNVGLGFWIVPKLSVNLDMRVDLGYQQRHERQEWFDEWSQTTTISEFTSAGMRTHIAPISSFMVSFYF